MDDAPSRSCTRRTHSGGCCVSLFGVTTPIPAPFGSARTGLLVENKDRAVSTARPPERKSSSPDSRILSVWMQYCVSRMVLSRRLLAHKDPILCRLHVHSGEPHLSLTLRGRGTPPQFPAVSPGHLVQDVAAAGAEIGRSDTTYRGIRTVINGDRPPPAR
jgi:hypothetical protein